MAQIIRVTSEALQATVRRLLPSQVGFGEDLQASNVIQPIIDLTPTAEGSEVRSDLQTALAFDSQTAFTCSNTTTVIANTPGFYRIFAGISVGTPNGSQGNASFSMTDGFTTKTIWSLDTEPVGSDVFGLAKVDFTVFLGVGESVSAVSNFADTIITGSSRQIATATGELVNPAGFTPQ